ncbi:hypothetical protein [Vibrio scophthalmi]|uniref:Uncharacterized protein n=1 Tax=Vibrio scophthalmi TaxID=45658 RepID=A0A1E3WKQ8_9VIBR|nr:hypothetical protein [Vibrio scophthalmi]ODS10361.1 hypothetical protein VSF3289_00616 [Vibrio scophthalmi]
MKSRIKTLRDNTASWLEINAVFISLFFILVPFLWFSVEVNQSILRYAFCVFFGFGVAHLCQFALRESNKAKYLENRVNLLERTLRR